MGKEEKGADVMSGIKPIQATPELSGKDALEIINQTQTVPTEKAIKKNIKLRNILNEIRK